MFRSCSLFACALLLVACGSDAQNEIAAAPPACSLASAKTKEVSATITASAASISSNRFILKFKAPVAGASTVTNLRHVQRIGASLAKGAALTTLGSDLSLLILPDNSTVEELTKKIPAAEIDFIEPDYKVHATYLTNDPQVSRQWAHGVVNSQAAWNVSRGSASVTVAVLDSGLDYGHEDLAANVWTNPGEIAGNGADDDGNGFVDDIHGWNFVSDNNQPNANDGAYHGTHVAGTIGAVGDNGVGISGHAPNVKLMALKFLDSDGSGYTSDAIKGIRYAIANGAKIINNSWGGGNRSNALSAAIDEARAAGVLFVVSAGNSGSNNDVNDSYPANYPQDNIIRVAASDSSDHLASWSNFGPTRVDLAAPGVGIYSTKNGNAYQTMSGTSMAAPLVSGVLATMIAARPDLNYRQIRGALLESVDVRPGFQGRVAWHGRVNAGAALAEVVSLAVSWVPPPPPAPMACVN